MTSRQIRNQRRAAERKSRKLGQEFTASPFPEKPLHNPEPSERPEQYSDQAAAPVSSTRAEINRANSQHSTGPRTQEGKMKSSKNSFKHGLCSKQLVLPSEDPAELDQLRASLRAEHLPVNTTEEILVNEIAENFWRIRRMREFEARTMQPENVTDLESLLPMIQLIQRTMASAERGFYKSLATLRQLQKDRGFVSQIDESTSLLSPERSDEAPLTPEIGFVSQKIVYAAPGSSPEIGFVSQKGHEPLAEAA